MSGSQEDSGYEDPDRLKEEGEDGEGQGQDGQTDNESEGQEAEASNETGDPAQPDELTLLKARASRMGIPFSNNIGIATLKMRIEAKMAEKPKVVTNKAAPGQRPAQNMGAPNAQRDAQRASILGQVSTSPVGRGVVSGLPPMPDGTAPGAKPRPNPLETTEGTQGMGVVPSRLPSGRNAKRQELYLKHMRLVRVRIQNLDPKKKDLPGEVYTVANELLGTVSKFVPFGEVTDGGYHLPYCLYKLLDRKKFVNITVTRDRATGREIVKTNMAKEFAFEILPQLTPAELQRLAIAQAAAGSVDGGSGPSPL